MLVKELEWRDVNEAKNVEFEVYVSHGSNVHRQQDSQVRISEKICEPE